MKTGLVIEDNEDNMVLIFRLLEKSGYKVLKAYTGRSGIEAAEKYLPDFIILDIQLPDINGTEVLKQLRISSKLKGVIVIAMTSYAMAGDRERLLAAGCDGYIEKPVDPERVIRQIGKLLGEET